MKQQIVSLIACVLLLAACSKDPKPDRATPFIGSWRTELADSSFVTFQTFWKIERSGPNMVKIATTDSVVSRMEDFIPSFAVERQVYNVRIDESDDMILNYSRASPSTIFTYAGTASIVDGKLIAKIQETSGIDGSTWSKTTVFHK
ncbi:MAG: hypothetical protein J7619_07675 [Dyadobacter sp.]|uniref:hypothetical protein n=1 Tax=Dyadobacter sp. TaxID=1914288 RepID=UPI001B06D57F|nr:hypothetical protein [Dyadobacter sp.]MBO9612557.1 hypothetical protein [Dyadobacter sp.]